MRSEPYEPWFTWSYRTYVRDADCDGGMMRDYVIAKL
jgi:hypothetical protein